MTLKDSILSVFSLSIKSHPGLPIFAFFLEMGMCWNNSITQLKGHGC